MALKRALGWVGRGDGGGGMCVCVCVCVGGGGGGGGLLPMETFTNSRMLSANQYELAFVAHSTAPYWFELLRISSLPLSY